MIFPLAIGQSAYLDGALFFNGPTGGALAHQEFHTSLASSSAGTLVPTTKTGLGPEMGGPNFLLLQLFTRVALGKRITFLLSCLHS